MKTNTIKTKLAQEVKIQFHFGRWFLKPIIDKNKLSPDGSVEIKKAFKFLFFTYSNVVYFSVPREKDTPSSSVEESATK